MSGQPYANVTQIRPLTEQHVRMAWLLKAKDAARRALDAALAAPRKAAGYLSRAVHALHLDTAVSWLHRTVSRLTRPVTQVASRLGTMGLLAAATGVFTSPTGRALLNTAGRGLGQLLGWVARKTYSGVDRVLRCFGRAGNTAADKLFAGIVSVGGKVATVATPVVHRVARLSDPTTTQARVLSGICQSYVVHKLLKAFIGNGWLRLLVELVLVPAVLDSRLWAWTRSTVRQARTRAERLHEQAQVVVDLERQSGEQLVFPDDVEDVREAHVDEVHVVTTLDQPVPSNRAERRAAQRQGKRSQQ
jgi:hypothetical protein